MLNVIKKLKSPECFKDLNLFQTYVSAWYFFGIEWRQPKICSNFFLTKSYCPLLINPHQNRLSCLLKHGIYFFHGIVGNSGTAPSFGRALWKNFVITHLIP